MEKIKGNRFREIIHPVLIKLLGSKTTGELEVIGELPEETCLIVANHLCIEDIPTLGQAVQDHTYLLVSDEDKKTLDGFGLYLNGINWVNRLDKKSRQDSSNKSINILKNGKNFAMYPEATWNLSPNQLIMKMNYGCLRIAQEANVPIIPVVSYFENKKRVSIIGEKFYPTENLVDSIRTLRDIMATMVYEQLEKYYKENIDNNPNIYHIEIDGEDYYYEKRENIDNRYWDKYVDEKYEAYQRAKKDKPGVREYESQFIFTPKTDDEQFFQVFNSRVSEKDGFLIKRISSEKNGYNDEEYKDFFGYGYNEKVLKKELKR